MRDLSSRVMDDIAAKVPGLLFWQVCVLAAVAGALASRYPLAGAAGGAVLFFAMGRIPWQRRAVMLICLLLGCGYAAVMRPALPLESPALSDTGVPLWAMAGTPLRVRGVVAEVSGQPDRRLRILLKDVRPADSPADTPEAVPGLVNWSWDQGEMPDTPRPLPGQTVTLVTRILPVDGFANEGVSNSAEYWADRGVWFRAWTLSRRSDEQSPAQISGQAGWFAAKREAWRGRMVAALGGSRPILSGRRGAAWTGENVRPLGMTQAQAVLPALLFGDRYALDSATLDLFTRAGLVHSLALSGQHLALAGLAAALLVWLLSRGKAGVLLRLPRRALILALGLPFAALYLWVGGAPPSLVRAALMMLVGALLWLGRRPVTLLDTLFFAVLCFFVAWPAMVFDLSVRLSVLSVAGIALALPWLRRLDRMLKRRMEGKASGLVRQTWGQTWGRIWGQATRGAALLLGTSVAVQVTTTPVLLATFGRVSPWFPLNLLWLPVLGALVLPLAALGLALLVLFGPQGGPGFVVDMLFAVASLPAAWLMALLEAMRDHGALPVWQGLKPLGAAVLGYAAAVAAVAALPGRRLPAKGVGVAGRLALCAAVLLPMGAMEREVDGIIASGERRVTLRVLDVGQGQALAVEYPGGRLLLDGGGSLSARFDPGRDVVAHALTANRPPRLDMVMASHSDLDHARGLKAIVECFGVGLLARSALPLREEDEGPELEALRLRQGIPLRSLLPGDYMDLGHGVGLEVFHPPAEGRFSSNNGSLIVRLIKDGRGLALFCGDAQIAALRRMLASGRDIGAEVLVVPHHGSAASLLPEFYDAVAPRLALISCGKGNGFGFPKPEVLAALAERGIEVRTTADCGELRVTWADGKPARLRGFLAGGGTRE